MNDAELILTAKELIRQRFLKDRHHIAAVLRTRGGAVYTGVHLEAYIGRIAVCAEAIAIGAAATAGDTDIETIVAVNAQGNIVSPCGMCRELISDYAPSAKVIIQRGGQTIFVAVAELLPDKFKRCSQQ